MQFLVVKIVLLVSCCYALPTNQINQNEADVVNEIEEDLPTPKNDYYDELLGKTSGDLVSTWNETSLMNPEEMGAYDEGDIKRPMLMLRNGLRESAKRWKNGIIPYSIDHQFKYKERLIILQAIADFHLLTCMRFKLRTTEKDYISIRTGKTGCWSYVGRTGGSQVVNLQSPGCVWYKGTVQHELLHAIGFEHEHNRWERNRYITVHFNNIKPKKKGNFYRINSEDYNSYGIPYDYNSVMHYTAYAFSVNHKKTMEPKVKGVKIGQHTGLSWGDVLKVNKMYNCKKQVPRIGWNSAGVYDKKKYRFT